MKIKSLLYCCRATKKSDYLIKNYLDEYVLVSKYLCNTKLALNGKIVCECEVETEEIEAVKNWTGTDDYEYVFLTDLMPYEALLKHSCLDNQQMENYLEFKGYALHLSNVKERVMELNQVYKHDNSYDNMFGWVKEENEKYIPITKAPQNMCWVYVYENGKWVKYLLISVRPQWLCLIANEIKDIEVRRKVLKGMVG